MALNYPAEHPIPIVVEHIQFNAISVIANLIRAHAAQNAAE
jgi:hypothetical protein